MGGQWGQDAGVGENAEISLSEAKARPATL